MPQEKSFQQFSEVIFDENIFCKEVAYGTRMFGMGIPVQCIRSKINFEAAKCICHWGFIVIFCVRHVNISRTKKISAMTLRTSSFML